METCCKKTVRSSEEKKTLENRLNRIEGQIHGIKKMVQEDSYCNDLLIQIVAAENAMRSLANHVFENHLYTCIADDIEAGNLDVIDELASLFRRFNK